MNKIIYRENPCTPEYIRFKKFVLAVDFPWFYNSKSTHGGTESDLSFYSHFFLGGTFQHDFACPGQKRYSKVKSEYIDSFDEVLEQIFQCNNMQVNQIHRMNANAVHPVKGNVLSEPHVDHYFPHKNLLIYLTDAGGDTICEWQRHTPLEDDIITFEGLHHMVPPKDKRRVVLVVTYS